VLLKKKYPNICLLLTRDGPYVDELGTYAVKMGVEGNVVLTQNVSDPLAAIKSCDVYTHISMNESLGLAILEAMALGVPVLASRTGGIPEIVKDNINGLMVAPDVEEVAAAIYKMLSDKTLMDRLVGEGRKTSEQYTWDNTATKFITLFNKLMNGAGQ
jgi:glycosyltransferase involved in cell wall biosynthesis